jgi:O-Antigen ligase
VNQDISSPRQTAKASTSLLIGWLALYTFSYLKPAAAFEFFATQIALGTITLFAIAYLFVLRQTQGGTIVYSGKYLWSSTGLLALIWGAFWMINLYLHPEFFHSGRKEVFVILMAILAYLVTYRIGEVAFAESPEREGWPALYFYARWVTVLLGMGGFFAVYQCFGPESWPMSFAALKKDILESMSPTDPLREGLLYAMNEGRASGVIGAPNIFASFCVFGWCSALGLILGEKKKLLKTLAGLAALGCLLGVFLSQSNGGILALIAGTITFGFILSWKYLPRKWALGLSLTAATLALLGAFFVLSLVFTADESSRLINRSGMTQRFFYWKTALSIFQESPLLGAGPGGFEGLYALHRIPGANETRMVHSWFFKFLSTSGLIGLGLFFAFIGSWKTKVLPVFFKIVQSKDTRTLFVLGGLLTACSAISLHGLIEYAFSFQEALVLLFATMGIIAGICHPLSPKTHRKKPHKAILYPMILTLVAVFSFSVYTYKLIPAKAKDYREIASYLVTEGGKSQEILSLYEKAITIDPADPANWEHRGIFRLRRGDARGIKDLENAMAHNPHSSRLKEQMAMHFASRKQYGKAIKLQQEAVEGHPLDVSHLLTLAELYEISGDHQQALTVYEKTLALLAPTQLEAVRREAVGKKLGYSPLEE